MHLTRDLDRGCCRLMHAERSVILITEDLLHCSVRLAQVPDKCCMPASGSSAAYHMQDGNSYLMRDPLVELPCHVIPRWMAAGHARPSCSSCSLIGIHLQSFRVKHVLGSPETSNILQQAAFEDDLLKKVISLRRLE